MTSSRSGTRGKGGADGTGPKRVADGIYKYGKSGLFAAVFYETGPDGKRKQRWLRGYRTLEDAKAARVKALSDQQRGVYVKPDRQRFEDFYKQWEKATQHRLRPSTAAVREHAFRTNIVPYFEGKQLQDIRPADLVAWHGILLGGTGRKGRSKRPLGKRSVAQMHTYLRTMFRDARAWEKIATNPCDAVKPPKFSMPEMRTWSATEVGAFIGHVRVHAPEWLGLFMLAASSGARRGELVAVQWQDLDLDGATWTVRQSLVRAISTVFLNSPKSDAGRRTVQLDSATVVALKAHKKRVAGHGPR